MPNSSANTNPEVTARSKGEDIDNWTMGELETLVELYKRYFDKPGVVSKYKLQDIDLDVRDLLSRMTKMKSTLA